MAKIEDFKTVMTDKKNFHINMGDKIVVTKENIDFFGDNRFYVAVRLSCHRLHSTDTW